MTYIAKIIGAYDAEVGAGQVFEEILHRLPRVKTLKVKLPLLTSELVLTSRQARSLWSATTAFDEAVVF